MGHRVLLDPVGQPAQQVQHSPRVAAPALRLAHVHLARGALHEIWQELGSIGDRLPPAFRIRPNQLVRVLAGRDPHHPYLAHHRTELLEQPALGGRLAREVHVVRKRDRIGVSVRQLDLARVSAVPRLATTFLNPAWWAAITSV